MVQPRGPGVGCTLPMADQILHREEHPRVPEDIESGDDAVSIEAEAAGDRHLPDEAAEQITVSGFTTKSNAARAVSVCGGINQINVPYINGLRVRNVVVTNFTGTCSLTRQSAFLVGSILCGRDMGLYDRQPRQRVHRRILCPGPGSSNGGGFGRNATLKCPEDGSSRRSPVIANVAGAFGMGEGYTGNETVNLTGHGPGDRGKVFGSQMSGHGCSDPGLLHCQWGPQHDGNREASENICGASTCLSGTIRIIEILHSQSSPVSHRVRVPTSF